MTFYGSLGGHFSARGIAVLSVRHVIGSNIDEERFFNSSSGLLQFIEPGENLHVFALGGLILQKVITPDLIGGLSRPESGSGRASDPLFARRTT